MVHKVKNHKGKNDLMVMKLDMKKAYDRMKWTFIIRVLKKWGFSEKFYDLLYSCLNSDSFSLLLNGSKMKSFKPGRGL